MHYFYAQLTRAYFGTKLGRKYAIFGDFYDKIFEIPSLDQYGCLQFLFI